SDKVTSSSGCSSFHFSMMGMSLSVSFLPMAKVIGPRPSELESSEAAASSPLSDAESVEESEEHAERANAVTAVVTTTLVRVERKLDFFITVATFSLVEHQLKSPYDIGTTKR